MGSEFLNLAFCVVQPQRCSLPSVCHLTFWRGGFAMALKLCTKVSHKWDLDKKWSLAAQSFADLSCGQCQVPQLGGWWTSEGMHRDWFSFSPFQLSYQAFRFLKTVKILFSKWSDACLPPFLLTKITLIITVRISLIRKYIGDWNSI